MPPGKTDYFQPVDAGAGNHLKKNVAKLLDERLENDIEFQERWCAGRISASECRILLTKLVAQAFEEMCTTRVNPFRRYFEKTGCLLTIDGAEDHLVAPEALDDVYNWKLEKDALLKHLGAI